MKTATALIAILACTLMLSVAHAQQPLPAGGGPAAAKPSPTQKNIETYLRHLYALGSDVKLVVGPLKESPIEGVLETNIEVTTGEDKQEAKFLVSKDGRFLFRGELSDLTKDPLAETRKQIQTEDAPTLGDPQAPVTLIEFSDFQCPVCRSLHDVVRGMLPSYSGKLRIVFKDFPLEQLHPWARTAALAGRCAYRQDVNAFWKMYDLIYDNQELISAENAWNKMLDYAAQARLNADTFKTCMASPEPAAAVNASRANGQQLAVSSTPTVFVNGRRLVGADPHLLEQYINYELAEQKAPKTAEKH